MVRLRYKRFGRTHRPFYRLCAMDRRSPRNGQAIEELGTYDPCDTMPGDEINFKLDRIKHWLSVGAQPSETVADQLVKLGLWDKKAGKPVLTEAASA